MKDLNITYYFGQIREESRGKNALFMKLSDEGEPNFKLMPLDSSELVDYTSGLHSPMRSYIGVNKEAEQKLKDKFEKGNLRSAFGLDVEIVREEIVKRRYDEVSDLQHASISAAVATGK